MEGHSLTVGRAAVREAGAEAEGALEAASTISATFCLAKARRATRSAGSSVSRSLL